MTVFRDITFLAAGPQVNAVVRQLFRNTSLIWFGEQCLDTKTTGTHNSQNIVTSGESHLANLPRLHCRCFVSIRSIGFWFRVPDMVETVNCFRHLGSNVTGIEISKEACALAQEYDPATKLHNGSFLDDDLVQGQYQGIYCFNVLQLFPKPDRIRFVRKSAQLLAPKGLMFFTGISDQDESFGQGEELRRIPLQLKPGKILHFFSAR